MLPTELFDEVLNHLDPLDVSLFKMTSKAVNMAVPARQITDKDQWLQFQRLSEQSSRSRPLPGRPCCSCIRLRPLWRFEDRELDIVQHPRPICVPCRAAQGDYEIKWRIPYTEMGYSRPPVPKEIAAKLPSGAPGSPRADGTGTNGSPIMRTKATYSVMGTLVADSEAEDDTALNHASPTSFTPSNTSFHEPLLSRARRLVPAGPGGSTPPAAPSTGVAASSSSPAGGSIPPAAPSSAGRAHL
ncbi:MAG: hypothetical protein Q9212_001193 [Teloschistes hypoglaucus]